ncbi:MAG: Gfo/Idh/MocA family oxidoreductase [Tessaracoccus sp.]|uniref:Gfo/Idh/MocA family protein n=1 Tax=Tessaracoccus sp. TaxID=1971211 RepID=UPI001ED0D33A|nr:Gfo/Idh/MocA family oxidoreductase [Tessaracoccus sp.]MBK7822463.1 Gfo/Idh/MocA family oxidoreductase [Tessaracoccus sp.]
MVHRIGVVGGGWRAQFFLRLASTLKETFDLVGVSVRRPEARERLTAAYGAPAYATPAELVRGAAPDFVVVSVSAESNADVTAEVVAAGAKVLAETPPAPTMDGMRRMWARLDAPEQVQVAEQYLLMPGHAARLAAVRRGVIGEPTSVHVSSTHGYHAVSLIRGLLGLGEEPAVVRATRHEAPLVDPLSRAGWTDDQQPHPAATTIATLDFGDRLGVYDFTDNQWHNRLRHRRILIRGTRGEIENDSVLRMTGPRRIVTSPLVRSHLGHDLNLDGFETEGIHLDGEFLFENPFLGHRLMDEEIAMAALMAATGEWAAGRAPAPYPLREAMHDAALGLAIEEAAETGTTVDTRDARWQWEGAVG